MAQVQEGMPVVDAAGDEIGKVEAVQMGDPDAVTTGGDEHRATDLLGRVAEGLGDEAEPDVPGPLRNRLRRSGYIKISGKGILAADRYVSSDRVREVSNGAVRLTVRKAELAREE